MKITDRELFADQFDKLAPYYDEVMSVVPYRQWVQYIRRILSKFDFEPKDVLDVACGTGSVEKYLVKKGYKVTGIDISPNMIKTAQNKAVDQEMKDVQYLVMDAAEMTFCNEFDLAISLFDSINYVLSSKSVQDIFKCTYKALRPGGFFIFDLNSEYALEQNLFTQNNYDDEMATVKHQWNSKYNKKTRIATVEMFFYLPDGRVFKEIHKERAHQHIDIIHWLKDAGFQFVDAYDAYSFLPIGKRSDRIFYVVKKANV
jgi:ubiquinone/menaquinone biosynthesis C-methylase UbiE